METDQTPEYIPIIIYWEVCRFCRRSDAIYQDGFCMPCFIKVHSIEIEELGEQMEKAKDALENLVSLLRYDLLNTMKELSETMQRTFAPYGVLSISSLEDDEYGRNL